MKKIISIALSAILSISLFISPALSASAAVPAELVGSGTPQPVLNYADGNYEMNIVPGGMSVCYFGGIYVATPDSGEYVSKYQIKYPADQGSDKLTFGYNFAFNGTPKSATLNVYAKDMTTKYRSFKLLYDGADSNTWYAADSPAITANDLLSFTVDMSTGAYRGTINSKDLLEIGNGQNSIDDLSAGIGMVELEVAMEGSGVGITLKGCSVKDALGDELASGIPQEKLSHTDGDFESELVPDPSNRTFIYYTSDSGMYVLNRDADRRISTFRIKNNKYSVDAANTAKLVFEFDVAAIGNPFCPNLTQLKVYGNSSSALPIHTISDLMWGTGEWKLTGNTPSSTERSTLKFTVDMLTGDWTFYAGSYQFTDSRGSGTIDISDGISMVELVLQTEYIKGVAAQVYNMKLSSVAKAGISDVSFKVDDVQCNSASEIEEGDNLKVNFDLYNSGAQREAVLIVAVYDGNKTIALKTKTVNLSGDSTEEISVDIPAKEDFYTVECYMFDSLNAYNPLSRVWSLE